MGGDGPRHGRGGASPWEVTGLATGGDGPRHGRGGASPREEEGPRHGRGGASPRERRGLATGEEGPRTGRGGASPRERRGLAPGEEGPRHGRGGASHREGRDLAPGGEGPRTGRGGASHRERRGLTPEGEGPRPGRGGGSHRGRRGLERGQAGINQAVRNTCLSLTDPPPAAAPDGSRECWATGAFWLRRKGDWGEVWEELLVQRPAVCQLCASEAMSGVDEGLLSPTRTPSPCSLTAPAQDPQNR
ncbi:hypothetical protein NHX12_006198 [Muraenolepis orangiensis]|uniref:Uncharacterized protein n=1 Tax=Muraenolepis orangiensis TaxID=630683 RepID=A0A9Q0DSS5_9TELE|nr:hypothetical protein NHX12_006198 [Muraenolepis orangiensis]